MIDITDRKEVEETLRRAALDAQCIAAEKEVIAEIGRIVGSSLDIESVYRRFAEEAHKLIAFERITITLVDDDTDSGIIAFTSTFGSCVDSDRPDLVLLDVMLPVVGGFQVLRTLKENERTNSIPVIMLSAKGQQMDIVAGINHGVFAYTTKPFGIPNLVARIDDALASTA